MEDIMTSLIRYKTVDNALDDLFQGFFMRPVRMEGASELQMKLDVREDDAAYTVHAEIPGVRKEDIHVDIDGNQVSISAEVKNEKEIKEGEKVLRSERYYGKVSRTFTLGQDVDEAESNARYDSGILELVLKKKMASSARRLSIQ
jgi:HSP20 family protein